MADPRSLTRQGNVVRKPAGAGFDMGCYEGGGTALANAGSDASSGDAGPTLDAGKDATTGDGAMADSGKDATSDTRASGDAAAGGDAGGVGATNDSNGRGCRAPRNVAVHDAFALLAAIGVAATLRRRRR